ncbi:NmrA family NAD(P)-binding protein [Streptomyces qinzhouensis]|uniref:Hydroxylase n=1 Tax=Streptomyces qinzhouensis TaxID=2599401 RepID=A0A5B8JCC0_9ACTN|nr:NmrA family NAD(P)-binding protein [Streptomyces qinzhouensis]QDY79465.1 hydroxylase [Streptomyces qinzhouensis]
MSYVIHGATGAQGAPVLAALTAAGKPVTAVTRDPGKVPAGVRAVTADYASPEELARAYEGADGVFVHLPLGAPDDRLAYARHLVTAIGRARPARVVVSTSGAFADTPGAASPVPADPAVAHLIEGVAASGVSYAVLAPKLFLENLLLPPVVGAARAEGVLRYPLGTGFPVSWASHLDVADAAAALLERPDLTGTVTVGQYPPVTGPRLAEAFGARFGREVTYEAITPEAFAALIAPLLGEPTAAGVGALYATLGTLPDHAITPENSAAKLLDLPPRTTAAWLADLGI